MALESADLVGGLNSSNPTGTDDRVQGDEHLRLIKKVLLNSFPVDLRNVEGVGSRTLLGLTDTGEIDGIAPYARVHKTLNHKDTGISSGGLSLSFEDSLRNSNKGVGFSVNSVGGIVVPSGITQVHLNGVVQMDVSGTDADRHYKFEPVLNGTSLLSQWQFHIYVAGLSYQFGFMHFQLDIGFLPVTPGDYITFNMLEVLQNSSSVEEVDLAVVGGV